MCMYFRQRERRRENGQEWRMGGEREIERIISRLHPVSAELNVELDPTHCGIITELESRARCLTD